MTYRNRILAAATLALPTLALCQTSTVQVYGRLDASVNFQQYSETAKTPARHATFVSSDTSWIGFRGTEDLGDGLSAYFKLESGFQVDTGSQSAPTQFFNRESLVGLQSNTWGSVQMGSQFTPSLWMTVKVDPFRRGNAGAVINMFQQGLAGPIGYPVAFNNAVQYISPSVGGAVGRVLLGATEGVAPYGRPLSTSLEYTADRLFLGASYDRTKLAGAAVGQPGVASVSLTNVQLGATYRFDLAKLHGYYIKSKVEGSTGMSGGLLGVSVPVGLGEVQASYLRRNVSDAANSDASTVALQYMYFLSKRTFLYVGGAHQTNHGNAAFGVWPARVDAGPLGLPAAGSNVSGYQVGMRHLF